MNEVAMNHELQITEATTMSGSPFINDRDDSLAMPSNIPENFEKENEVANEPVTKEVVDGGAVAVGIPLVIKLNTVRFTSLFLCRGCVLHFVFSYCLFDDGFSL